MDIQAVRQLFPVTKKYIFLNNAAESPLNLRVRRRIDEYLDLAENEPQNKPSVRKDIKEKLSTLFGGQADEYALVTSTGMGISTVAGGYKWNEGDNLVVPEGEHWNNKFPWQALKDKGVEIRFVPVGKDKRIDLEEVKSLTDKNTKIISLAAVSYNSGFRSDLKKISQIAHEKGALLVVDGIQAAGAVPINVDQDHIDILACGGFKWLFGMPGTGFLYVNKKAQELIAPISPGMFAADNYSNELEYYPDARRYETGTIAYSLFYGWLGGLELLEEVGMENIYKRLLLLTDKIISGLKTKDIKILSPINNTSERSPIIIFTRGSLEKNKALYKELLSKDIIVTLRDGVIRVSPSFFNTEEEIESFLKVL